MDRKEITSQPLKSLHGLLRRGALSAPDLISACLEAAADAKASHAHLALLGTSAVESAESACRDSGPRTRLSGLPVSVKDLYDVAGVPTTCGSPFFSKTRPTPGTDAGYVARWRRSGAAFTSKTHLNEFAYGITGENRWFGDCTIPGLPDRLTGGSSSGAAASILAGSAGVALGTDTGGSLRVPAALCGLVSYRQSHGFGELDGAFPLAHSFDTVGWIQRNLEEVAWIARQIHPELAIPPLGDSPSIGILKGARLEDVDPAIASAVSDYGISLRSAGATVREAATRDWEEALKLFVPIQAYEAASVHREFLAEHSQEYDPAILGRLQLGLELSTAEYRELQQLRLKFVHDRLLPLFSESEFLLAPATPVLELNARTNHSANRPRLLGLTTPASLGGMPVLTVPFRPGSPGIGFQLIGRPGADARLWALADWLATRIHDVPG